MEKHIHSAEESDSHWGNRVPVEVDLDNGLIKAGEVSRPLVESTDVSVALSSYLSMVYELRSMSSGVVPLRNEDIAVLADAFEMEETDIAEKLARLMHCDDLQTRRFVQMVKKGRVLVPVSMVAAGALLAATLTFTGPTTAIENVTNSESRANVELLAPQTIESTIPVQVELGDAQQIERFESIDQADETVPDSQEEAAQEIEDPNFEPDIQIGEGISVTRDDGEFSWD